MDIIIVTIIDPIPNYGNRLQHYAVKKVIEKIAAVDAKSLAIDSPKTNVKEDLKKVIHMALMYKKTGRKDYWKYEYPRIKKISKFDNEYFHLINVKKIEDIPAADFYVVGSDQVWNPQWYNRNPLKKDVYLLSFAEPKKKVCFAPSIGVEEIPDEWNFWFKKQLSTFPNISVREENAVKIVKSLTGKNATLLIDPTLMLTAKEWEKISRRPRKYKNEKYILSYFLGSQNYVAEKGMQELSLKLNAKIINLMDMTSPVYISGPEEFIYLFEHAEAVFTDSFHACVFSFIFDKPFLVFARQGKECNMTARIETLLKILDIPNRFCTQEEVSLEEMLNCDYVKGHTRIEKEQVKTTQYLKRCFNIK